MAISNDERIRLRYGPYETPLFRYGATVTDKRWGKVVIVGISNGRIPWPLGKPKGKKGRPSLVLYRGLVKAVLRESNQAIRYWFGVERSTVQQWRRLLEVPANNDGTSRLRSVHFEDFGEETRKAARAKDIDPERCAKIAASMRGKKRPKHVIEAIRKAKLGQPLTNSTRKKLSETHKRRGTRPPWIGEPWSAEEDELARTLPAAEVVKRTGRSIPAVYARRRQLGVPDGRRKKR
jgi:hypothetical protein